MDEEIIIGGFNVGLCRYKYICKVYENPVYCEKNQYCYFKQLKRKEQECEELKAQLNDMACMDDDNVLCYPRQELKKECEKYKQVLNEIYLIIDEIKEQYDILDISELEQIQDIINKTKDCE